MIVVDCCDFKEEISSRNKNGSKLNPAWIDIDFVNLDVVKYLMTEEKKCNYIYSSGLLHFFDPDFAVKFLKLCNNKLFSGGKIFLRTAGRLENKSTNFFRRSNNKRFLKPDFWGGFDIRGKITNLF